MNEDLIELPNIKDIRELLVSAKEDVKTEIQEDPQLLTQSKLLLEVINVVEEKLSKEQDLNKLNLKEKINVAAHLNFLQNLLEDFFFVGDFEGEDDEDEFEIDGFDDEEEEEEER